MSMVRNVVIAVQVQAYPWAGDGAGGDREAASEGAGEGASCLGSGQAVAGLAPGGLGALHGRPVSTQGGCGALWQMLHAGWLPNDGPQRRQVHGSPMRSRPWSLRSGGGARSRSRQGSRLRPKGLAQVEDAGCLHLLQLRGRLIPAGLLHAVVRVLQGSHICKSLS